MAEPTNTKKDREKIMNRANAAALKTEELSKAGGVPMDGLSLTGEPISTIGMTDREKFFAQGRALDQQQREGYASLGDKAAGETQNALRRLTGRPEVANTPQEFSKFINRSVGFGGESALLDQAGRDRAMKSGIGAGLSYEEADAAVSKAYGFLKEKYGDKTTPTTTPTTPTTPTTQTTLTPTPMPSTRASSSPTLPPEVPVEKGPIMQSLNDAMTGGTGERLITKGGSLFLKGTKEAQAAAEAAAEAAAKAAGATAKVVGKAGDVGARMRDTQAGAGAAPKLVGKAGDVGARMRQTQAGAIDEAAGAVDEAVAAAEKGKGAVSRLLEGAAKSSLGKTAAAAGSVAGKGLRFVGRAAGPALEIYDAGRYFAGDEEVKNQYAEDAATLGQRVFQPKSVGEFAGGVGDVLSPTKNVLGTAESVSQLLKSQRGARESEAALKNAQNAFKAREDRRKELYPDEVFNELPPDQQRKIRQSIRQEFRDAGVKTYGR